MTLDPPAGHNPAEPRVILATESYRCVLRSLTRWAEGYVDIEARYQDALDAPAWRHHCSVDLKEPGRSNNEQEHVLREVLRQRCDELGIRLGTTT